jgi:LysM repeat protein
VRGRVVLSLVAVACCLGLGAVAGSVADASSPAHGVDVVRHTVVSGETLWGVARSVAGKGDDVRDVVADIESLNRLAGPGLRAGQVIWLPAHH